MKKELKEKIVEEACDVKYAASIMEDHPKVIQSPDAYWVQAWIKVPLDAVKS